MSAGYSLEDKRAYAEWLVASPAARRQYGLPASKSAYAKQRGLADRTLRRWESDGGFQALKAEALARQSEGVPDSELPALAVGEDDRARREYESIRASLLSSAQNGDPKALDLYMKHFGGHFAAEEQAARSRGLQDKSDDELVDETLALIGRHRVLAWLNG